jgi:hypothetical protein
MRGAFQTVLIFFKLYKTLKKARPIHVLLKKTVFTSLSGTTRNKATGKKQNKQKIN